MLTFVHMKRFLRIFFIIIAALMVLAIVGGVYYYYRNDEPLPVGVEGPKAEQLADKMLSALNHTAWEQTGALKWSFRGAHHYLWDRNAPNGGAVEVKWDANVVQFYTEKYHEGIAKVQGEAVTGESAKELIETAWGYFCNDSFWLIAPFKVRDPGTTREWIDLGNSEEGLLVTYDSGGVTPGDSYLWLLDEDGTPKAWKMWVNIIPVGGMKATWEGHETYSTGVRLSTLHTMEGFNLELTDVAAGADLRDLGVSQDHFTKLE